MKTLVKSKTEEFFFKYEHLTNEYAKKIWNTNNIGMDVDDIKQELKIKLFLSIKNYAEKWNEYRKTGKNKPIPIEFYLKQAMLNKCRDFIKKINKVELVELEDKHEESFEILDSLNVSRTDIFINHTSITSLFDDRKQKRFMKLFFICKFDKNRIYKYSKKNTKKEREREVKDYINDGLKKIRFFLETEK